MRKHLQLPITGAKVLGRYQITKAVNRGAMGQVFLATDTELYQRRVAIKYFDPVHIEQDYYDTLVQRFSHEIKAFAEIHHPHVISILDVDSSQSKRFFVMEYSEDSLRSYCEKRKLYSWGEVSTIIRQCALGLHAAHQQGFVHRDIKPSNILIDEVQQNEPFVRIGDFGIVKLAAHPITNTGEIALGTLGYMAPEQQLRMTEGPESRAKYVVDHRADIYSLGVVTHQMITGMLPSPKTSNEHYKRSLFEMPLGAQDIIRKMLAEDPADRFLNMLQVVKALDVLSGDTRGYINLSKAQIRQKSTLRVGDRKITLQYIEKNKEQTDGEPIYRWHLVDNVTLAVSTTEVFPTPGVRLFQNGDEQPSVSWTTKRRSPSEFVVVRSAPKQQFSCMITTSVTLDDMVALNLGPEFQIRADKGTALNMVLLSARPGSSYLLVFV